jgi:hypothetical protein
VVKGECPIKEYVFWLSQRRNCLFRIGILY